jgi:CHAT domain-containing protein
MDLTSLIVPLKRIMTGVLLLSSLVASFAQTSEIPAILRALEALKLEDYQTALQPLIQNISQQEKLGASFGESTYLDRCLLALTYSRLKDLANTQKYLDEAIQIAEKASDQNGQTGVGLLLLANASLHIGNYSSAAYCLQLSLTALNSRQTDNPDTYRIYFALADTLHSLGDSDQAEYIFRKILRAEKSINLEDTKPEEFADMCVQLAVINRRKSHYSEALLFARKALTILEGTFGPNDRRTVAPLLELGKIYIQSGNYSKAKSLLESASRLSRADNTVDATSQDILETNGHLAHRTGDLDRARACFEQVLRFPRVGRTESALEGLCTVLLDLHLREDARKAVVALSETKLKNVQTVLSFANERQTLAYLGTHDPYWAAASLGDPDLTSLAILRFKGLTLETALENERLARSGKSTNVSAMMDNLSAVKRELTQEQLQEFHQRVRQGLEPQMEILEQDLRKFENLEAAISKANSSSTPSRQALQISVADVAKKLPTRTVLIESIQFLCYLGMNKWENHYGVAAISGDASTSWVDLGASRIIDSAVQTLHNLVRQNVTDSRSAGDLEFERHLEKMSRMVWDPIQRLIPAGTERIIFSPDGGLNFLPLAVLRLADGRFLVERYEVAFVARGCDLLDNTILVTNRDIVIFADPAFSTGGETPGPFYRLPQTTNEANFLKNIGLARGYSVKVFMGEEATESKLRQMDPPLILHLATHGFYASSKKLPFEKSKALRGILAVLPLGEDPFLESPMLRSGFALAGAQLTWDSWMNGRAAAADQDGIVFAEEISGLRFNGAWLVTLSACDTGIGDAVSGEGVFGLRRGFVRAGVQNIMLTLWPIADSEAASFMQSFYDALLKIRDPAAALAKVQRDWLPSLYKTKGSRFAVWVAGSFTVNVRGTEISSGEVSGKTRKEAR